MPTTSMIKMPANMPTNVPDGPVRYVVTLTGPKGTHDLDRIGFGGPESAARVAFMFYVNAGYGDLDEVTVDAVTIDSEGPY